MSNDESGNVDPTASTTARLIVLCDIRTGVVSVAGHIDNVDLCCKMLIEAGHILLERGAKIAMEAKGNGKNPENPTATAP